MLTKQDKQQKITYCTNMNEVFEAKLGSADLLLNWDHLRGRIRDRVDAGDIGSAFLKLALDVAHVLPDGVDDQLARAAFHFQSAKGAKSKHADSVQAGLRVLSIDLGVRSFATCSVFELKDTAPTTGVAFPLAEFRLWAVHERSFTLELPGENVGAAGQQWRAQADAELRQLRGGLNRHRQLLRAATVQKGERDAYLTDLREAWSAKELWPFEASLLSELERCSTVADPLWQDTCKRAARLYRTEFGAVVSEWRSRTRSREDRKYAGKSMWSVQHLTDVRRFLQSWSLAGRASGDIRRLDRERGGVFAKDLLDHIDALKDDRLKTGADLIVQAARGFQRNEFGYWVQKHAPCHVILFEDLSRYRMRTDRPRRENSQLMQWAHRGVPDMVGMQGEIYGIQDRRDPDSARKHARQPLAAFCLDTPAAFSSRYHASTMTPGIRCHPLRKREFEDQGFLELLKRENEGLDLNGYKPGDLVPLPGGEVFVCLNANGLSRIHADINAAQNLQRRFWTQHGDAFRLPCGKSAVQGQIRWAPLSMGKRQAGALGGFGYLEPTGHDSGSCQWRKTTEAEWRRLSGAQKDRDEAAAAEDEELQGLEEELLERSGERVVFFRDPSGVVLPTDLWFPSAAFWSIVRAKTVGRLRSHLDAQAEASYAVAAGL
ncbi:type V CRISPR-associated protein Cas12b [Methylobacterium nodulans]|uniref:Uncharacterized protein n=1 Tax=Methylobacterium nodulans (strain LMG 21967 / CNCM I-2342 / ORS 2060) TaxID=460265 RepID=B8IDM5_METNO|nr:hypothetical protein Mnod_0560 [Methylobacterium nodulans ORS 2060]